MESGAGGGVGEERANALSLSAAPAYPTPDRSRKARKWQPRCRRDLDPAERGRHRRRRETPPGKARLWQARGGEQRGEETVTNLSWAAGSDNALRQPDVARGRVFCREMTNKLLDEPVLAGPPGD